MSGLTLASEQKLDITVISNNFIDFYMCNANGEFVKIYLYLLRCTQQPSVDFSLRLIADKMNLTEGDVLRGLKYWEQQGLLSISADSQNKIQSIIMKNPQVEHNLVAPTVSAAISATAATVSSANAVTTAPTTPQQTKPQNAVNTISAADASDTIQELVLIAEQYLKRQLTSIDLSKIMYFYEDLHFSPDLIEYLLEHCATIGNRSIRYIESVAISWADKGITTVKQAKEEGQHYRREYFTIIKAFGIRNRTPIDNEVAYMKKWLDEYHFTTEVICEACQRTIAKTGNPVFAYADSILKNWKDHGILAKKDIAALDNVHFAQKQTKPAKVPEKVPQQPRPATRFNNFEQRSGYDFNQLEKQLNHT